MCPNCEDIYVMSPDGSDPTRLTHGGGAADDTHAYNSTAADWSHSKKLIAFQSNRIRSSFRQTLPDEPDGSEQQLLVEPSEGRGGFPASLRAAMSSAFTARPCRGGISTS